MKKNKIIKIMIIVLLLILLIVCIILVNYLRRMDDSIETKENDEQDSIHLYKTAFEEVDNYNTYFTVRNILNEYVSYIQQLNGDVLVDGEREGVEQEVAEQRLQESSIKTIKNILNETYLTEFEMNDNKIIEKYNIYSRNGNYQQDMNYNYSIIEMYSYEKNEDIIAVLTELELNEHSLNLLIKMDYTNNTYTIFENEYIEQYNYSKDMSLDAINIEDDNIQNNGYNIFIPANISLKDVAQEYYYDFKNKMLTNTQESFNILNEEYRLAKFGTFEQYNEFILENMQDIQNTSIESYMVNDHNDYTEFVCIDNKGRYYIIKENKIMDYEIMLDTYTVDFPEFVEEYNASNNEKKGLLNIQKIFEAINMKDYQYIYNKLDETFKQNNFSTVEALESYITETFYENNSVECSDYQTTQDLHIYEITIEDKNNPDAQAITKNFIVKLLDGTDFVMSFSI